MSDKVLRELLKRYQAGTATEEDKRFLESWYLQHNTSGDFEIKEGERLKDLDLAWKAIQKNTIRPVSRSLWPRIASAAAVLIIISFGIYFYINPSLQAEAEATFTKKETESGIIPGGNKAVLTLADGTKISLTDAPDGMIASQAGVKITKTAQGELIYEVSNSDNTADQNKFNTIETPRGGQYQVALPDGSRVWLNAQTSLKYPANFNGQERKVELNGEAYFEVASNKAKPFKVVSDKQTIEVLGTHFNANGYADEHSMITTLLEGSVKVETASGKSGMLKPGQQFQLFPNGDYQVDHVNAEYSVAWKNGKFLFRNEPIESVMRKIGRWYDVEIVYPAGLPQTTVWANVSRFEDVSDILELIELSKVAHFKIEGRRIIVMK